MKYLQQNENNYQNLFQVILLAKVHIHVKRIKLYWSSVCLSSEQSYYFGSS